MGTTGLETAFAALYTELVLPGELELATVVERMTAGGALYGLPIPRIAAGEPANLCLVDLDARFEVGAEGYASRSANCCFHGRTLQGARAADGRRRRGRVPGAGAERGGRGRDVSPLASDEASQTTAYVLLEDGARFDGAGLRRRRDRGRRDRVHDLDVGLPGGDDRPQLRRPADHVHLPADRQLRRLAPRRWSQTASTPARRSCAPRSTATTRPGAEQGWLALADRARRPRDHRPRYPRAGPPHPRPGRDARRRVPGRGHRVRGARADRGRAVDERPRPGRRRDPPSGRRRSEATPARARGSR